MFRNQMEWVHALGDRGWPVDMACGTVGGWTGGRRNKLWNVN